jgi:hypothetical protein
MNIQQSYHKGLFDSRLCQLIKSRNQLGIDRIDYIKDTERNRLVIFLESDLLFTREVNVFMNEKKLIIEAPVPVDYEKPFKTHLIPRDELSGYDNEDLDIGFSEVQLDQGYTYDMFSSQMINPGLLKVILSYHSARNKNKQITN